MLKTCMNPQTSRSHRIVRPMRSIRCTPSRLDSYPVEQRVNWGDCIRGWVIIQGPATTKMTKVRYTTESTIL